MNHRLLRRAVLPAVVGAVSTLIITAAQGDIPATYKGMPFNPAVAGGPKCPATVKAGPYELPGRLDFVNYDLGGEGISYHTGDHLTKGGTGYRTDVPTATFSLTDAVPGCAPDATTVACLNVWYDTSPTLDGTLYPSPTTADFTIGAVQNGDWFDFTVNVETAGTYSLSSTWATGNGPPGGEGGNGDIGLQVFLNGTMIATWSAVFPNSNTEADFHHWKAYPNFATVTLPSGPQLIKLQSGAKHLQLDYVEFALVAGDGGLDEGGSSGGTASGASSGGTGSIAVSGSNAATGLSAATGSVTSSGSGSQVTSGSVATSGDSAASGAAGTTTGMSSSGGNGAGGSGGMAPGAQAQAKSGKGCAIAAPTRGATFGLGIALALGLLVRSRKRTRAK
jgi:hypothetical protein